MNSPKPLSAMTIIASILIFALLLWLVFVAFGRVNAAPNVVPTPAATRAYYCNPRAPASWHNPGCRNPYRSPARATAPAPRQWPTPTPRPTRSR